MIINRLHLWIDPGFYQIHSISKTINVFSPQEIWTNVHSPQEKNHTIMSINGVRTFYMV